VTKERKNKTGDIGSHSKISNLKLLVVPFYGKYISRVFSPSLSLIHLVLDRDYGVNAVKIKCRCMCRCMCYYIIT